MKKSSYIPKPITIEQAGAIRKMATQLSRNVEDFVFNISKGSTSSLHKLTYKEAAKLIEWLNNETTK